MAFRGSAGSGSNRNLRAPALSRGCSALERIPQSVRLWKAAVEISEEDDARVLLVRWLHCWWEVVVHGIGEEDDTRVPLARCAFGCWQGACLGRACCWCAGPASSCWAVGGQMQRGAAARRAQLVRSPGAVGAAL